MIKTVMVVLNLVIALLFFTILYSAANIDMNVQVNTDSVGLSMKGTNMETTIPVTIENRGLYPIKDISISVNITNSSTIIYGKTFRIKEISALGEYRGYFDFTINLTEFYKKIGEYYVFHPGKFEVNIGVRAHYWVLAEFEANYNHTIDWKPLLYTYQIYEDQVHFDGKNIIVPYFVSKIPIKVNASVSMVIQDKWGAIARGSGKVVFDRKSQMVLHLLRNVDYLLNKRDTWRITCTLNIQGLVVSRNFTYTWTPPISNLAIGERVENGTPYLFLSFKNTYGGPLSMEIVKGITYNGETTVSYENMSISSGEYCEIPLAPLLPGTYHVGITIIIKNMNLQKTINYDLEVGA